MRQVLGPGALGRPRGRGWRGRWEGGSGWGTHVNPWLFHFNVLQNPLKIKKKKKKEIVQSSSEYRFFKAEWFLSLLLVLPLLAHKSSTLPSSCIKMPKC